MTPMLALADLDGRYIPYPNSARFRWLLWAPFIGRRAGLHIAIRRREVDWGTWPAIGFRSQRRPPAGATDLRQAWRTRRPARMEGRSPRRPCSRSALSFWPPLLWEGPSRVLGVKVPVITGTGRQVAAVCRNPCRVTSIGGPGAGRTYRLLG